MNPHRRVIPTGQIHPSGRAPSGNEREFFVVGVGAPADASECLGDFFSRLSDDVQAAFVVVFAEGSAREASTLASARLRTLLPVHQVEGSVVLEPKHIYVVPRDCGAVLRNGVVDVVQRARSRSSDRPIDAFFQSLARSARDRAVGVLLSGVGSDGVTGLAAIEGEAGFAIAQHPGPSDLPRFEAARSATLELAPSEAELARCLFAHLGRAALAAGRMQALVDVVPSVCAMLRQLTGNDFSRYKQALLVRRIERRMALHRIEEPEPYLGFLSSCPFELEALFRDLLIGATRFFRDAVAWNAIDRALVDLIANRPDGHALRVWVAGCSSGEEAYSLAIALHECIVRAGRALTIEILATDLDDEAITLARVGHYPAGIAADVRPERLERFFTRTDRGYRVSRDLRRLVVFAAHDLLKDPPPSTLDAVFCRNVLIYLESEPQRRLLSVFHDVLRRDGLLVLGPSETIGEFDRFVPLDRKWRIFRRAERPFAPGRSGQRASGLVTKASTLPLSRAWDRLPSRQALFASDTEDHFGSLGPVQGDASSMHEVGEIRE